jgi:16S rRNA (cytosine967-C5)-methyltransferase
LSAYVSRLAAGELLMRVLDRQRTLDDAMLEAPTFLTLEGADRGFARAIASAALRRLGQIDAGLAPLMSRPLNAMNPAARALLRAGAAQLWLMDVAPHAAVRETVEAARHWTDARQAGAFLNAVLRRASEARPDTLDGPALTIWPDGLQNAMTESLGATRAEAYARAAQTEAPLHLSARDDAGALASSVGGRLLPAGTVALEDGYVEALPGFEDGAFWVQDAAAALPVRLLDPQPGEAILDLCAAPGGKTMQLAAAGAHVTALDRSGPRLKRLKENLIRTRLKAQVIEADALSWTPDRPFSKILLDAPCSALGTLRRHPEGAFIKGPGDLARFTSLQVQLLMRALSWLRPGGRLVYCVCSPLKAEGADIVSVALAGSGVRRAAVMAPEVPGFEEALTPQGDLLTGPSALQHADAFYISRLIRE